ncbi:MAG: GAF domain-containing protein [candidate division Zixibacteria bacterium]|nr:GAF domain-containing protein [candidate division Zixibacteria bacterium]
MAIALTRAEPRIQSKSQAAEQSTEDLHALLEISIGINATMRLEDTLQVVMKNAIDLLNAERGFIMLLDDYGQLQFKTAYNLKNEEIGGDDFRISNTIANKVAQSGKPIFTSDAQDDERFANQASVQELHLRSIICVPMTLKNSVIGIIYLDNSRQAKHFLKTDLYLLQLLAGLAASAVHNATLYEHLLDLKQFTEKVVNRSPVGILVINSEYQLISINDAALQVFEKNKEQIHFVSDDKNPTRFFELVSESAAEKWRRMIDISFTTGKPFEDARYFHNTGYIEKALSVKISPIDKLPLESGGLVMTIEDITEKVIMEKYVILSEKLVARGEMSASIAHELNNYLTIINNNAELLTRNLDSQKFEKVGFNCKQITDSIGKMKRFTNGLMDSSKLDGEFISYDIKRVVEDLLFSLRAQKRFKEILFTTDLSGPLPNIQMDVGQIQQVFLNLMNNAADALEERQDKEDSDSSFEKHISISAKIDEDKKMIVVEFADNALGMDAETISKLFQPHFTTKKDGHGLGLANCKKIAARHEGSLTAESKPGEGSLFRLALPLDRDDNNDDN